MTHLARTPLLAALLTAASVALVGCGGATPAEPDPAAPSASSAAPTEPTTEPTTGSSGAADPAASTSLLAVVGTDDDPEAFEIALTDANGEPVTTLPAGDYSLTFVDRSSMHNFHLTGPGSVDVATDVAGSDESTVEITLVEGTYDYVCDPHAAAMRGSLEVTG